MPLLTGIWKININGIEGEMNITNINADGSINGSIASVGGQIVPFLGFWNESAQSIFLETMTPLFQSATGPMGGAPGGGDFRAQFFGYLFSSQGSHPAGADIKWTICGHVSTSPVQPFPGLVLNSRRTIFGWYAEVNQVM